MEKFNDDTFLARWLNNELTAEELTKFEASEDYAAYKKLTDKSLLFEAPNFDSNKIKASIMKNKEVAVTKVRSLYYTIASIAAILLIGGLGGNYFFSDTNTTTTYYATQVGERINFELPDGSIVDLNGMSKVAFNPKDWDNNIRTLNLEGEAFFKVQKGSKFTVQTKQGKVSVLGTQFDVKDTENYFAVNCFEGKVQVDKGSAKEVLTPGKGIQYFQDQKDLITFANASPFWIDNQYKYNNVPLQAVLLDLQNVYNVTIKTKDPNKAKRFTGNLITNNISKALLTITKPLNLTFSITKDDVVFIKENSPNE